MRAWMGVGMRKRLAPPPNTKTLQQPGPNLVGLLGWKVGNWAADSLILMLIVQHRVLHVGAFFHR